MALKIQMDLNRSLQIVARVSVIALGLTVPLLDQAIADYATLADAANTFKGLLHEGARVTRGEGERAKEEKVHDFRQAMAWLITQAESATARQRYKGLGEMNPQQLWETTMDPEVRRLLRVQIDDAIEADRVFTMLMGDEVEPRRNFIESNALRAGNIDI